MSEFKKVYLVTRTDVDDGSGGCVQGIYSTRAIAEAHKSYFEVKWRDTACEIEEWPVDELEI